MKQFDPTQAHTITIEHISSQLDTGEYGLSTPAYRLSQSQYGLNELPQQAGVSIWRVLASQFHSTLVYILLLAAGISIAFGHVVDAIVIVVVVLINAVFGFVQEYRSEAALRALKQLVKDTVRVVRDGQLQEVEVNTIVPGDLLFVESGDQIPADGRVFSSHNLLINEAALTGESVPQSKQIEPVAAQTPLPERVNMVYSGTVVASGEGKIIVTATGSDTELGKIATDVQSTDFHGSRFMDRVNALGTRLGYVAIAGAVLVMIVGYFSGLSWFDTLLLGVASAVSAIPEGLPVVLAVVLAVGVQRMAAQNAIVKRLSSVEPLGITTTICTDKTGTLTQNVMTVTSIFASGYLISVQGTGYELTGDFFVHEKKIQPLAHEKLRHILLYGALANRAEVTKNEAGETNVIGDPTEVALVVAAAKAGLNKHELLVSHTVFDTVPFSSDEKFQAVLLDNPGEHDHRVVVAIGAFEALLPRSSALAGPNGHVSVSSDFVDELTERVNQLAAEGHRVIALAAKHVDQQVNEITSDSVTDMTLLGFCAIIDPPRQEVPEAIANCKAAGVRLIMATGDSKATAVAIARQIGLLEDSDSMSDGVFAESEIADYTDEQFADMVKTARILARVSPSTKLRLVQALQDQAEVVAMTGDGVNDAPALKAADIGVAMGKVGTDVARETAQIVLSDDNFASLVNAIKQGRIVFNNVRKTTGYLITTNVAELMTLLVVLLLGLPLPLLPIQILLINLVTDGLPVISLAFERDHGDVLSRPPLKKEAAIVYRETLNLMIINSVLMVGGVLLFSYHALAIGALEYARTMAFVCMGLFQSWNMFNMRSTNKSIFRLGFFSNTYVMYAFLASICLQLLVVYTPLNDVFSLIPLAITDWLYMIAMTFSVILVVEIYKYFMFKEKRFVQF